MRYAKAYSHHNGQHEWAKRDLFDWLTDIFEAPSVEVSKGATAKIREHVRDELTIGGWSGEIRISPPSDLTIFSMKGNMAFQIQTGNISRAPYDLLKLEYLYKSNKIELAALAVPTREAANALGDNIANFSRIMDELSLFDRVLTVPLLLLGFE